MNVPITIMSLDKQAQVRFKIINEIFRRIVSKENTNFISL